MNCPKCGSPWLSHNVPVVITEQGIAERILLCHCGHTEVQHRLGSQGWRAKFKLTDPFHSVTAIGSDQNGKGLSVGPCQPNAQGKLSFSSIQLISLPIPNEKSDLYPCAYPFIKEIKE